MCVSVSLSDDYGHRPLPAVIKFGTNVLGTFVLGTFVLGTFVLGTFVLGTKSRICKDFLFLSHFKTAADL